MKVAKEKIRIQPLKEEIKVLREEIYKLKKFGKRSEVLERDNFKCRLCQEEDKELLEVHHLTERSDGGDNSFCNLITVCSPCHMFLHCNPKIVMRKRRWYSKTRFRGSGRPAGSKDKRIRNKEGYIRRWSK